jgi:hypothetical protein
MNKKITFNNGSLGSRIDEERSEMRYVVWIAEVCESSNLWTQIALFGIPRSMPVWGSLNKHRFYCFFKVILSDLSRLFIYLFNKSGLKLIFFGMIEAYFMINFLVKETHTYHHSYDVIRLTIGFSSFVYDIFQILTSNQVRTPAELKHINKRRKRK